MNDKIIIDGVTYVKEKLEEDKVINCYGIVSTGGNYSTKIRKSKLTVKDSDRYSYCVKEKNGNMWFVSKKEWDD